MKITIVSVSDKHLEMERSYIKRASEYLSSINVCDTRVFDTKERIIDDATNYLGNEPNSFTDAVLVVAHMDYIKNNTPSIQFTIGCGLIDGTNSQYSNSRLSYCNWSSIASHRCGCRDSKGFTNLICTRDLLTKPFLNGTVTKFVESVEYSNDPTAYSMYTCRDWFGTTDDYVQYRNGTGGTGPAVAEKSYLTSSVQVYDGDYLTHVSVWD